MILDEEAGKQLDEMTGTLKSGGGNKRNTSPNLFRGKISHRDDHQDLASSGGASRFFYCAKASSAERNEGCESIEEVECQTGCGGAMPIDDDGKKRDRFKKKSRNNHPTVKPLKLMQYLLRLIAPPKDALILDPFAGSGTTVLAAKRLGIECIGIEKSAEYCEIANARLGESEDLFTRQYHA